MPKQKRKNTRQTTLRIGDISDISGNVNVAGRDVIANHTVTGLRSEEIIRLFDQLYRMIETNPKISPAEREDLNTEVKEIQSVVTKADTNHENVNESFLLQRLRNIARMAPDMLDVIVATLVNPVAGWGVALKKIAEKAKEEKVS